MDLVSSHFKAAAINNATFRLRVGYHQSGGGAAGAMKDQYGSEAAEPTYPPHPHACATLISSPPSYSSPSPPHPHILSIIYPHPMWWLWY
jgi:hypothetical protein